MANRSVTKQQLQNTLDEVGEQVGDMLDPALSREQIVERLQELDEMLNGSSEEEDDDEETEEEEA